MAMVVHMAQLMSLSIRRTSITLSRPPPSRSASA
jgi:hypothetical protein